MPEPANWFFLLLCAGERKIIKFYKNQKTSGSPVRFLITEVLLKQFHTLVIPLPRTSRLLASGDIWVMGLQPPAKLIRGTSIILIFNAVV